MSTQALLFLTPIYEFLQATEGADPGAEEVGGGDSGNFLVPMLIIMAIFYFVLIAPERKKQKKREAMLSTMRKGERVMTTSGMYGTVVQVQEDVVTLQVADNVRLKFSKAAVQTLLDREEKKDEQAPEALPEGDEVKETV